MAQRVDSDETSGMGYEVFGMICTAGDKKRSEKCSERGHEGLNSATSSDGVVSRQNKRARTGVTMRITRFARQQTAEVVGGTRLVRRLITMCMICKLRSMYAWTGH